MNPILGNRPSLENHRLTDLNVDPTYQRSIECGQSDGLIRRIAKTWDWSLYQPLSVSRRTDGTLWVVDGQHRLAAARMRDDVHDLPCVVTPYADAASEASAFVAMNRQRRPLSALDLFKARLASNDPEALTIMRLIADARLSLANHSNYTAWRVNQVSNIGGICAAYRQLGSLPVSAALVAMSTVYQGQVLQYAGTIFMPIARCYATLLDDIEFDPDAFIEVLGTKTQRQWVDEFYLEKASTGDHVAVAGEKVLFRAYAATQMQVAA